MPLNLQVHLRLCCLWQELQITNKEVWNRCRVIPCFLTNLLINQYQQHWSTNWSTISNRTWLFAAVGKLFIFNVCFNSNKLCYHHLWNQVAFTLFKIISSVHFRMFPCFSRWCPCWCCQHGGATVPQTFQQKVVFHMYNLFHYILFFTNHLTLI